MQGCPNASSLNLTFKSSATNGSKQEPIRWRLGWNPSSQPANQPQYLNPPLKSKGKHIAIHTPILFAKLIHFFRVRNEAN